MVTVWKFELEVADRVEVELPAKAKILHVGTQDPTGRTIAIWAEVRPELERETRIFNIAGTGHRRPEGEFVGSVIAGPFVWHIYEEKL